jgi:replication factor C small subunit
MIVTDEKRKHLRKMIDEMPNILIIGHPGVGKGTFVDILLRETGLMRSGDFLKINASMETSVENVRSKVFQFATALGVSDKKIVYMNEADRLSPHAQDSLNQLIEDVHEFTRFVFLANEPKLDAAIVSRCQQIDLDDPPADQIFKRCCEILRRESVRLKNPKALVGLIKEHYPDVRKIINEMQKNVQDGELDEIRVERLADLHAQVLECARKSDLNGIRKVLRSHVINYSELYAHFFENVGTMKAPGDAIILIGEYLYRNERVAIKEINFLAMVAKMLRGGVL